jgi:hypothetical protein
MAALGLTAATLVIPQAQASIALRHPTCESNPGYFQGQGPRHPCGPPLR